MASIPTQGVRVPIRVQSTLLLMVVAGSTCLCAAQDGAAPLYASTGVVVNGTKPLAHEVLPGDMIDIPPNETAILHPSGDEIFLAPQSSAVYLKQAVQLRYGTTKVSTSNGLGLVVHQYHVSPINPVADPSSATGQAEKHETKYEVMWSDAAGGRVRVYEGEVLVDGCEKKLTVPKDKMAELGRDCKVGADLRPGLKPKYMLGLAAPAAPPIICHYLCPDDGSPVCPNGKSGSGCVNAP